MLPDRLDHLACLIDLRCREIQVGDQTNRLGTKGHRQHAVFPELINQLPRVAAPGIHLDEDDIGIDTDWIAGQCVATSDCFREPLGVLMVFHQPFAVVFQRVQGSSSQDTSLSHTTAKELSCASCGLDKRLGTGQGGTDGSPQALAEADADGIEVLGPLDRWNPGCGFGIEQPGAIQMGFQLVVASPLADVDQLLIGPDRSATSIVGVFQTDQARPHQMIPFGPDHPTQLIEVQDAILPWDRASDQAA